VQRSLRRQCPLSVLGVACGRCEAQDSDVEPNKRNEPDPEPPQALAEVLEACCGERIGLPTAVKVTADINVSRGTS
jgi:hypothetical protein